MHRRRSHKKNNIVRKTMKGIRKTAAAIVPKVEAGLENLGSKVSSLAVRSAPTVKKGLSSMYGILKTGTNAAVRTISSTLKRGRSRRHKKSRRHTRRRR